MNEMSIEIIVAKSTGQIKLSLHTSGRKLRPFDTLLNFPGSEVIGSKLFMRQMRRLRHNCQFGTLSSGCNVMFIPSQFMSILQVNHITLVG